MATNKFLKFDESDTNMLDFATYQASLIRTDGFPFGSKPPSTLTNRFYRDTAGFAYAFGEFMKAQGLDASPDDLAALIVNIPVAITMGVITDSITASNKIITPVANLAALKAIVTTTTPDSVIIECKSLGLFRFDSSSTLANDNLSVIQPTTGIGRWIKIAEVKSPDIQYFQSRGLDYRG